MAETPPASEERWTVERTQRASVWNDGVYLEVVDDGEFVRISITREGETMMIRLTKTQWQDIRAAWNAPM